MPEEFWPVFGHPVPPAAVEKVLDSYYINQMQANKELDKVASALFNLLTLSLSDREYEIEVSKIIQIMVQVALMKNDPKHRSVDFQWILGYISHNIHLALENRAQIELLWDRGIVLENREMEYIWLRVSETWAAGYIENLIHLLMARRLWRRQVMQQNWPEMLAPIVEIARDCKERAGWLLLFMPRTGMWMLL